MKHFLFTLVILVLFASCGTGKSKLDAKFDDSLYELVDKGFYKGKKDGKMYIKTSGLESAADTSSKVISFYTEIPPIDLASFKRLSHAGFYAKDTNHVYIWETTPVGESIRILEGANPSTFESFGYRWGKDTTTVFYDSKKVNGLNPHQTTPVCMEELDSSMIYIDFIRDNDQLFYRNQEIKVPANVDILKIYCKVDLLGNSFLAVDETLYMVKNNEMILYK